MKFWQLPFWKHPLTRSFLILFAVLGGLLGASLLVNSFDATKPKDVTVGVKPEIQYIVRRRPACAWHSEEDFGNKMKLLTFAENQKTHGIPHGSFVGMKDYEIKTEGGDDFACGFVRVTASKGGKPLDTKYETPFIAPQEFGGHLALDQALFVKQEGDATVAYFSLRSVPYFEEQPFDPHSKSYHLADWATLLNVNSRVTFQVALNTADPQGVINEVAVAYKCWNPDTGEEGSDCTLAIGE